MSLMLKLLATALLTSSLFGAAKNADIENFLYKNFKNNTDIRSIDIKVISKNKVEQMPSWDAFILDINAVLKDNRKVNQKMIWFSNGVVITQELVNLKTGTSLKDDVSPKFKSEFYKKANLIYGDADAKHKVAIFSDPLCPFCRTFVPESIEYMKKRPKTFAIYYYHFPLPSLHPAAVELTKAAIAAELRGHKEVVLNLYKVDVNANERNVSKILKAFNKTMGTNIKPNDLKDPAVVSHYNRDQYVAEYLMVQGTPTMFFDGTEDKTKKKFRKIK